MNDKRFSLLDEIALINRVLREHKTGAETSADRADIAGKSYVVFGLKLFAGAKIARVEGVLRELAEALSDLRSQPTPVRLRQLPLALEVPHPAPEPLIPTDKLEIPSHCVALGKSWAFKGGEQDEILDLAKSAHVLIAGTTGSGKSKLLTAMLWSLCRFTSPADVRLVLVDLKNEDLVPFAKLPHVERLATTPEEASEAIWLAKAEKDRRVREGADISRQRLVLVIDELAELASIEGAMGQLASVLAIGRSKHINVITATQKPLSKLIGSIAKANLTVRLVGQVMSRKDAEVATDQPSTGAEFLPGAGAFLRVEKSRATRFQSYYLEDPDEWLEQVSGLWFEQLSFPLKVLKGE